MGKSEENQKRKQKKKSKQKRKPREVPLVDNKGLSHQIPKEFMQKINFVMNRETKLRPFGPCNTDAIKPDNDTANASDDWSDVSSADNAAISSFFGYTTLHLCSSN